MTGQFPRLRFVGDTGLLVEFGDHIDEKVHDQVLNLDRAIAKRPFLGLTNCVPSYTALLVGYDPCATLPADVRAHIHSLLETPPTPNMAVRSHQVPACYDAAYAPDLSAVADQAGLTYEAVIAAHLSATYRVYMCGFAPGFAYLGSVPASIQLPRRPEPIRDVPVGSMIIAGPQCAVTTLVMPSGWWNIGRTPVTILRPDDDQPFLFGVGDEVRFVRIDRVEFERLAAESNP